MKMTQKEFDDFCKNVEIVSDDNKNIHWRTEKIGIYTRLECPVCEERINLQCTNLSNQILRGRTYCGYCGSRNITWETSKIRKDFQF